ARRSYSLRKCKQRAEMNNEPPDITAPFPCIDDGLHPLENVFAGVREEPLNLAGGSQVVLVVGSDRYSMLDELEKSRFGFGYATAPSTHAQTGTVKKERGIPMPTMSVTIGGSRSCSIATMAAPICGAIAASKTVMRLSSLSTHH